MLEITKININNFYSIGSVSLNMTNGLHYVVGVNADVESVAKSSNGSGKTASFSGIYQGLYNKNIKNPKGLLESVNNSISGKPYSISITFKKGVEEYEVINDRNQNKISIISKGTEIQVKGIANQLKQIKDIIGLDFETFSALTYISQGTLQAILDTTNKDNILYQFFNVDSIHKAETLLKEERKELKNLRTILITKVRGAEKNLELLTSFEKVDVESIEQNVKILTESLLELSKDKRHTQVKMIEHKINQLGLENTEILGKLNLSRFVLKESSTKLASFKKGKCPTCGHISDFDNITLTLQEEINKSSKEIKELEEKEIELSVSIKDFKEKANNLKVTLEADATTLSQKINLLKSKLLVVKEQNSQYEKIISQKVAIEEGIKSLYQEMSELDVHLNLIEQAILLIKDGTLVNEYLNKFRKVFTSVLKDLMQKTDFGITTSVTVTNGKLDYRFFERGVEKGYNDLSAGERTRVSLVLLISTIFTLEKVTGFSSNYLVIDEMLGVLDDEGIEMVKKFLDIIRKDKAVYLITHHEEIPIDFFDSILTFTKTNGITELTSNKNLRN